MIKILIFFCSPLDFYLPTRERFASPYTSQDMVHNLLSDEFWMHAL